MFTGIVETTGLIRDVEARATTRRFFVEEPTVAAEVDLGDSVAVDGACLTVSELEGSAFGVDVIGTTLERTIAGLYREGTRVNLERAVRAGDRLDGHIVQGHVDGVGRLIKKVKSGAFWLLDFTLPTDVHDLTIEHGSVAINGVSLTVSELLPENGVRIGVIPVTHRHTNLGTLAPDDGVNVEGDMIGKYVARLLAHANR